MDIQKFFEEIYISQEQQCLTPFVLDKWNEGLSFLDNNHERMEQVQATARQCIASNNKEIYDMYVTNLLIEKGVLK